MNRILFTAASIFLSFFYLSSAAEKSSLTKNPSYNSYFGAEATTNLEGIKSRVFGGYLKDKNKHLSYGLELGETIYSHEYIKNISYSRYSIDLLGILKYNPTPKWNVIYKYGFNYHPNLTVNNKISAEKAIALNYNFNEKFGIEIEI